MSYFTINRAVPKTPNINQVTEKKVYGLILFFFIKVPTQGFSRPAGALIIRVIKRRTERAFRAF